MGMCWPQQPKELEIKVEAEVAFRKIKKAESMTADKEDDIKTKIKSTVRLLLKKQEKIPRKTAEMLKALKLLCRDKNLYISRLDKGNGVVLMDKSQYIAKMNDLLADITKFKEIETNNSTFTKKEDQTNRKLLQLKKKGEITEDTYQQVRSTGCQPSRLYGLPKLHKDEKDPPLRPILSMVNSYCANLAKWILSFLAPLSPSKFSVKDSFVAAEKIAAACVSDMNNIYLVSFDAIQLFTNIPVQDTIEHIVKIVPADKLPISKDTLKILLRIACTEVPFIFNKKTYVQIDGLSMGSCLAPLMAEFALHMVEETIIEPRLFLRYADDCLAVFQNEVEAEEFLLRINSCHPALQFTIEKEEDKKINFLDMTVYHKDNVLRTKWYVKPTNTLLYTHQSSVSPTSYKKNAIRALYVRSQKLTTDNEEKFKAKQLVKNIFLKNGYSERYIEQVFSQCELRKDRINEIEKEKIEVYWKLPYTASTSAEIKSKVNSMNKTLENTTVKIAFKTLKTQFLCPNKDKIEACELSSVVYKYSCEQCQACYIGETRRQLQQRIKEHIKGRPPSEISMHIHPPNKNNFQIVTRTKHTRTAETIIIKDQLLKNNILMNNYKTSEFLLLF